MFFWMLRLKNPCVTERGGDEDRTGSGVREFKAANK